MRSLAIRRNYRGLSQVELATRTGISEWKISKFEKGRGVPDLGELRLLAEALGVPTQGLRRTQIEGRLRLNLDELASFEAPGKPRRGWKQLAQERSLPDGFLAKLPSPAPLLAFWVGLISEFAEAEQKSPFLCGFVGASLLDAQGRNVAASPLPCLRWNCLAASRLPATLRLWPQMTVRTQNRSYGVAALVNIHSVLGSVWAYVDLPETSAAFDWDPGREANLALPRLLLTRKQMSQGSWRSELEGSLVTMLPTPEPILEGLLRSRNRGQGKVPEAPLAPNRNLETRPG